MRHKKKVSINDVARVAGVSRGTVSRAFNRHRSDINERTKKRILAIAKRLGYFPNHSARGLVKGRTECIGIIVPDLSNPFLCEMVTAIERHASEEGFASLLAISCNDSKIQEQILSRMCAGQVDGIVITPCEDKKSVVSLNRFSKQKVIVSLKKFEGLNCDVVAYDDGAGVKNMMEYLLENGHRKIAFVCPKEPEWTVEARERAYRDEMKKAGLDEIVIGANSIDPASDGFISVVEKIINLKERPTAIFAYTDFIAVYLIRGLKRLGIKVPEDISVVGFDNISLGRVCEPELTTVSIDGSVLGKNVMLTMIPKLRDDEQRLGSRHEVMLKPNIVIRGSVSRR